MYVHIVLLSQDIRAVAFLEVLLCFLKHIISSSFHFSIYFGFSLLSYVWWLPVACIQDWGINWWFRLSCIPTTDYCSTTVNVNEVLIYAAMWMNLQNMLVREARHKTSHIVWFRVYETFRISKSLETECRLMVVRGWEKGRKGRKCLMGEEFSFGVMEPERTRERGWLHSTDVVNASKLFTLKWLFLCYVNITSTNFFSVDWEICGCGCVCPDKQWPSFLGEEVEPPTLRGPQLCCLPCWSPPGHPVSGLGPGPTARARDWGSSMAQPLSELVLRFPSSLSLGFIRS